MRLFLISALLLSLASGCSSINIGPHRIDVQQGNALDQENVARLKPGLNRSQVRFLLGTPLIVDPFRTDRWDYVYVFYKAGKLAEQKRITLFFDGETLARIEGDLPVATPDTQRPAATGKTDPQPGTPAIAPAVEPQPLPTALPPQAAALPTATSPAPQNPSQSQPVAAPPAVRPGAAQPAAAPRVASDTGASQTRASGGASSIVSPLPSPESNPAYVDPRPSAELSLQPETHIERVQPDVIPAFPGTAPAPVIRDEPVLTSLNAWANAWAQSDENAYFAAYAPQFVPPGGGSRADWERRKRQVLGASKRVDIKIDSPSVEHIEDGTALVTFNQFYRSDRYSDAVVKQLRMVQQEGRWVILEEKVLSTLSGVRR